MAEIVGTAVATEAVSRISSILSGDKASHESAEGRAERLEMAVLKIRRPQRRRRLGGPPHLPPAAAAVEGEAQARRRGRRRPAARAVQEASVGVRSRQR